MYRRLVNCDGCITTEEIKKNPHALGQLHMIVRNIYTYISYHKFVCENSSSWDAFLLFYASRKGEEFFKIRWICTKRYVKTKIEQGFVRVLHEDVGLERTRNVMRPASMKKNENNLFL